MGHPNKEDEHEKDAKKDIGGDAEDHAKTKSELTAENREREQDRLRDGQKDAGYNGPEYDGGAQLPQQPAMNIQEPTDPQGNLDPSAI